MIKTEFEDKHKKIITLIEEIEDNVSNTKRIEKQDSQRGKTTNSTAPMGSITEQRGDDIRESVEKDIKSRLHDTSSNSVSDNSTNMDRPEDANEVEKLSDTTKSSSGAKSSDIGVKRDRGSYSNSKNGTQPKRPPRGTTKRTSSDENTQLQSDSEEFRSLSRLYPEQQDDVAKAQKSFTQRDGILFTNGTGTGKTATGAGVMRVMYDENPNIKILIVTPSDTKNKDWIEEVKKFVGLEVYQLKGIKDRGKNISVTTYANFAQNEEILKNNYGLIVYDESHKLLEDGKGGYSTRTIAHFRNSNHSGYLLDKEELDFLGSTKYEEYKNELDEVLKKKFGALKPSEKSKILDDINFAKHQKDANDGLEYLEEKVGFNKRESRRVLALSKEMQVIMSRWWDKRKEIDKDKLFETKTKTKVVFLSATPYKGHFSLDYGDEFITNTGVNSDRSGKGYNTGSQRDRFYIENFGYSMRYNKLTKPDVDIDTSSLEIIYTDEMIKSGAMSGRTLKVDADYSRKFFKISHPECKLFKNGIESIGKTKNMNSFVKDRFHGYPQGEQLIEGKIGEWVIDRIKKHLKLGRKIVVFHKYSTPTNKQVFNFSGATRSYYSMNEKRMVVKNINNDSQALSAWKTWKMSEFPKFSTIHNKTSVPEVLKKMFGSQVVFFNGKVPKSKRRGYIKDFNEKEGINIICVQEQAGKEGISLHDTTGQWQRVMLNCSKPVDPIAGIQIEGRIYRLGTRTNAIFEYPIVGTDSEMWDYINKINKRVGTVENLAMGSSARGLSRAFKEGYLNANSEEPNDSDGTGTKEEDYAQADASLTPYQKAKAMYHTTSQKGRNHKGSDFFATPDPIGFKMVEFGQSKRGESCLEPSAGQGSIARYFEEGRSHTFIEFNGENRKRLGGVVNDSNDVVQDVYRFEDYSVGFRHDVITMNPPFGTRSTLAYEHTIKALSHLKAGGRVVALLPESSNMNRLMNKWLDSEESSPYAVRGKIKLPASTFERAGTRVMTTIWIIDRIPPFTDTSMIEERNHDLSSIEEIGELFDRMEDITSLSRLKVLEGEELEVKIKEEKEEKERERKALKIEQEAMERYLIQEGFNKGEAEHLRRIEFGSTSKVFELDKLKRIDKWAKNIDSQEKLKQVLHEIRKSRLKFNDDFVSFLMKEWGVNQSMAKMLSDIESKKTDKEYNTKYLPRFIKERVGDNQTSLKLVLMEYKESFETGEPIKP